MHSHSSEPHHELHSSDMPHEDPASAPPSHHPLHSDPSHTPEESKNWPVNAEAERIKQLIARGQPPVIGLGQLSVEEQHHFDPEQPRKDEDPNWFTPWLVIPAFTGDDGTRPILSSQLTCQGIWVERFQQDGTPISIYTTAPPYQVAVQVDNRGYSSSYGTIVEFYFSTDPIAGGSPAVPIGSPVAITVPEGGSAIARSGLWTPPWSIPAYGYLTVRTYDPVFDAVNFNSFDPLNDRHVSQCSLSLRYAPANP